MAQSITIYHNPRCGKSRGALTLLRDSGQEIEVVEYLKTPLDRETIEDLLDRLEGPAEDLVRRDRRFRELGIRDDAIRDHDGIVEVLLAHPELMQRPVVARGDRAIIARPSDLALKILVDHE